MLALINHLICAGERETRRISERRGTALRLAVLAFVTRQTGDEFAVVA